MALKIGIVGLPNVGKSTIFNALTRTKAAEAQNYPFCTIEPNVGIVEVPDHRIHKLAEISSSDKVIPTAIEFVDIAGLVQGASEGEGLGNKFLSHIRECSAIAHIVRSFKDSNVTHVHGEVDPKFDREVIESELLLSDIQTLEKRLEKAQSDAKSGDKEKKAYSDLLESIMMELKKGKMVADMELTSEQKEQIQDLHFLSSKPYLYVVNLHEDDYKDFDKKQYADRLGMKDTNHIIPICAKMEEELADFSDTEAREYLTELGLDEPGLDSLIKSAYNKLGLITYFTSGPKETRAWTIRKNTNAPQAAGKIHTDFETGFIKAEVIDWEDFINSSGHSGARDQGLVRMEGKDYVVTDGDVILFRFNN
ncbi:redox-regulated ATPase YchF [Patescibacteria group bacterium]